MPDDIDPKAQIAAFIEQMKKVNGDEVNKLELPLGTEDFVAQKLAEGDVDTLMFMLKLGYIMGLQTGFAAAQAGQEKPPSGSPFGPIQA